MKVEQVELTEAQAYEMRRATTRVLNMLRNRASHHGAERYTNRLTTLKSALKKIEDGERDALRLSLGMDGENREQLIGWLEREVEMMEYADSTGRDEIDGRKINALKRGIESMKDPEIVDTDND